MNNHDLNNVRFIMSLDLDELKHWWESVSEDERNYASEIMDAYSQHLKRQSYAVSLSHDRELSEADCAEARQLLSQFTL